MKLYKSENCGNSPKNKFIEEFIIDLFEEQNIKDKISENITIELIGMKIPTGLNQFSLKKIIDEEIMEIYIYDAISHGKKGAIDLKLKTVHETIINIGIFLEFKTLKADKISYLKIFIHNSQK